ncbi:MAG: restriction endonuclease subunit S, partial [Candidatus Paceibacterota bacterium]
LQRNKVFEILASGNMIPGLSRDDILSFKIPCPPEEQQEKISEIFSMWDEAISKTEKLIQAKKRYKKGLMQRLLSGKVRFPEFEGEEWVEVKLGDITTEKRIKGKSVELNTENRGMPYIGSTSFKGDFTQYTDDPKAVIAKKRDLLLLWDGEYAGKITTNLEGAASSTVAVIKLKSNVNNMYLKLLMEYENGKIRAITEGSGIPHIPKDFIKWYKVKLPSIEEQSKIVDLIAGVESEVSLLTHKADLFKKQKKGLMQQLLTGKLRVNLN